MCERERQSHRERGRRKKGEAGGEGERKENEKRSKMMRRCNKTTTVTRKLMSQISVFMEIALFFSLIVFIGNIYLNFKMRLNEWTTALISFIHESST